MQTNNKLIAASPELQEKYEGYLRSIFNEGPLTERERILVGLTAALTLKNESLTRTFVFNAKEVNVENGEIGHVSAIVDALRLEAIHAVEEVATAAAAPAKRARTCC